MKKILLLFIVSICLVSVIACSKDKDKTSQQQSNSSNFENSSVLEVSSTKKNSLTSELEKGANMVLDKFELIKEEINKSSAPENLKNELIHYVDDAAIEVYKCKTLNEMLNLASNVERYVIISLQNYW